MCERGGVFVRGVWLERGGEKPLGVKKLLSLQSVSSVFSGADS